MRCGKDRLAVVLLLLLPGCGTSDTPGQDGDATGLADGAVMDGAGMDGLVPDDALVDGAVVDGGPCGPNPECTPGASESGAPCCDGDGQEQRTCDADCTWGDWACVGCPTLEMAFNGQAYFQEETSGIGSSFGLHCFSHWFEGDELWAYYIIGYELGGIHRLVTGRATSTDGVLFQNHGIVLDIGGTWERAFNGQTDLIHEVGNAWSTDAWEAHPGEGSAYLAYSPFQTGWSGPNLASFSLVTDDNSDGTVAATIDVYDGTADAVLASRNLLRNDWSSTHTYEIFSLDFNATASHQIQLRVYFHNSTYLRINAIGTAQGTYPFFDDRLASFPGIWRQGSTWYLVYEGAGTHGTHPNYTWPGDIGLATSTDGIQFTRHEQMPFLAHNSTGWESANIGTPSLHVENGVFYLFYHGFDLSTCQVGVATFTPGQVPQKHAGNPILPSEAGAWDSGTVGKRSRIYKEGSFYYMAYEGSTLPAPLYSDANWSTGLARSPDLLNWQKSAFNPVIPQTIQEFGNDCPELVKWGDRIYLYVRRPGNSTRRYVLRSL